MSSRNLDAANVTASTGLINRPIVFCEMDFDSGVERVHTEVGVLTWGGNPWQGVGDFGAIDSIQEGQSISPYGLRLAMSGLDSGFLASALTEDYQGRNVILYLGFLDAAGALLADPDQFFNGDMDQMPMARGREQNAIALECESELMIFDLASNWLFNDTMQQQRHSGDKYFEFQAQMLTAQIAWGEGKPTVNFSAAPTKRTGGSGYNPGNTESNRFNR